MTDLRRALHSLRAKEEQAHAHPSDVWGLDTGFRAINRLLGGLQPGLNLVGARTSQGKSVFVMQVAMTAVRAVDDEWRRLQQTDADAAPPGQVLIYSPEMTTEALVARYATQQSRVPSLAIKRGEAAADQRRGWLLAAAEFVAMEPCFTLRAGEPVSVTEVLDEIEDRHLAGPPVRLVVIDYLQYLDLGRLSHNYFEALGQAVKALRVTSNRLNIPLLVAAQLNRSIEKDRQGGEERPPELSDFEGTGKIEQTANVAMLLWRPPEPNRAQDDVRPQKATVFLRKNTDGPTGVCELHYYPDIAMFADLDTGRVLSDGGTV